MIGIPVPLSIRNNNLGPSTTIEGVNKKGSTKHKVWDCLLCNHVVNVKVSLTHRLAMGESKSVQSPHQGGKKCP